MRAINHFLSFYALMCFSIHPCLLLYYVLWQPVRHTSHLYVFFSVTVWPSTESFIMKTVLSLRVNEFNGKTLNVCNFVIYSSKAKSTHTYTCQCLLTFLSASKLYLQCSLSLRFSLNEIGCLPNLWQASSVVVDVVCAARFWAEHMALFWLAECLNVFICQSHMSSLCHFMPGR